MGGFGGGEKGVINAVIGDFLSASPIKSKVLKVI